MDYSILLGIELAEQRLDSRERIRNRRVCESQCGKYIYHICIIDYLQSFNMNKRAEIAFKTTFKNAKASTLSAISPEKYAVRFLNFMKNHVFNDNNYGNDIKCLYIDQQTKEIIQAYNKNYSLQNFDGDDDELGDSILISNSSRKRATSTI